MIKANLNEVSTMIGGILKEVHQNIQIEGVSIDTRNILRGNLFIPLAGTNSNGHLFIKQAIQNGASAALWQKNEPNPPKDVPLIFVEDTLQSLQQLAFAYRKKLNAKFIGITGSNGKTTTKEILSNILSTNFKVGKTIGNFNNEIGVPLTLLSFDQNIEIAILEMGMSHKGDIELLSKIVNPDISIITNIGHAHLCNHGSIKNIATVKWEILRGMPSEGILIYNGDQKELVAKARYTKLKKISFGMNRTNDFYIKNSNAGKHGCTFEIADSPYMFDIPLIGEHQIQNALSAITVASLFGLSNSQIQEGLSMDIPSDQRFNVRTIGHVTIIDDTYKSNLESVIAALKAIYHMQDSRKKIFIMGDMVDMGDRSIEMHQEIANHLSPVYLDSIFSIGNFSEYTIQIAEKNFDNKRAIHFTEESKLIHMLKQYIEEPCILLFKASRELKFEKLIAALEREILL
ncbi:UDP-N-acetylmuramoyl-tripeptide--D-alanyl-D-alanine ligase [Lysinibacillus xylanilyticus]|uniref:UDP-N-acetylmuramoyl-tripeptide--D-alanyl-D- alanine ligase n=1 Tax=Lysinibacillus xylanilyticus TaxID=582475 RepID=UPI0038038C68